MKTKLILFLLLAYAVSSCKNKGEDVSPYTFNVNSISTQDVKLFFIIKDETVPGTSTSRLVKIKSDDTVESMELKDANGNAVSDKLRPVALSNANPDFMLMSFAREGDAAVSGYLVNKRTGGITAIDQISGGAPTSEYYGTHLNYPLSYYDGSNYLYFIAKKGISQKTLVRVSTVNPNYIAGINMLPDSVLFMNSFGVDADKNIMVSTTVQTANGTFKDYFYVFNSSSSAILPISARSSYWVGPTGNFNYLVPAATKTTKVMYSNNSFSFTPDIDLAANNISSYFNNRESYRISFGDKFIMVSGAKIVELDNAANTPKQITTVPVSNQKWVDHSQTNGLIFIAGENASGQQTIFKIDIATNYAYTTYPTPGKYNFYEIEAFEDGTVYATAKRNSDGKYVILKFAPNGTETLLNETLNKQGIWLEKVTEFTNN